MGDLQDLAQSVVLGVIFAFLVAKLVSFILAFREDHLRVVRDSSDAVHGSGDSDPLMQPDPMHPDSPMGAGNEAVGDTVDPDAVRSQSASSVEEKKEDDDWEGVESTELDEEFVAATAFIAAAAADRSGKKVPDEVQLQLYGYYKIATEGPCNVPQPSAFKMVARAKWNAWQRLGTISPEEAMENYIKIVNELYPTWAAGGTKESKGVDDSSASKEQMGPVFSSLVYEDDADSHIKLDAIHVAAREGNIDSLLKHLEHDTMVDLKDSDGRTALHWAVDRGHLHAVKLLVSNHADVNIKDNDGQTSLHYAVLCEREAICEYLINHGADINIQDGDERENKCGGIKSPSLAWPKQKKIDVPAFLYLGYLVRNAKDVSFGDLTVHPCGEITSPTSKVTVETAYIE